MEEVLKRELGTSILKRQGRSGGGCISEGAGYETDHGVIFVKKNTEDGARQMFDGEFASLQALYAVNEVKVPKPIRVLDNLEGGAVLVTEYLDIGHLSQTSQLGKQLASLHQANSKIRKQIEKEGSSVHQNKDLSYVDKFGFDVPTCCGFIPQNNNWTNSWEKCYAQKIEEQIAHLETKHGDRVARDLWSQVLPSISSFFHDLDIEPALLHGDLWSGNVGQTADGPVIFDPASFYGHAEYDLAISKMFGGIGSNFFNSYFEVLPKQRGYENRLQLYTLFHYMNHWNHFGGSYKDTSLQILRSLVKEVKKS